jgi:hypothetical protein
MYTTLNKKWLTSCLLFNILFCRIPYFGMLRCVALVRIDVSEEHIPSIIKVTKIGELATMLAVTSN